MKFVGMSGGIGCGKSTVATMLRTRGADVIDVDVLSRELQQPGQPLFEQMVRRWGQEIVDADGRLDRAALGRIVFADKQQLAEITAMAAPITAAEIVRRASTHMGTDDIVVMESAMQLRSSYGMEGMIVVDAAPATALARLVAQRGMSEQDANARIASQPPRTTRLAHADFVITNDGELVDLEGQVALAWDWVAHLPDATPRVENVGEALRTSASGGPND